MYRPDYDSARRQSPSARYLNVLLIGIVVGVLAFVVNAGWGVPGFLTTAREGTPEAEVDENYQGVVSPRGNDGATLVPVATATSVVVTVVATAEPVARVPDFALPGLLDETVVRRVSDYAGRPFILNFWASWCVPCRAEMPALERVYVEHEAEGLGVLGVHQTAVDDVATAQAFVRELGLTFPSVRDGDGSVSSGLFGIRRLPVSIFVTAEGAIARTQIGQLSDDQIEAWSHELVDEGG